MTVMRLRDLLVNVIGFAPKTAAQPVPLFISLQILNFYNLVYGVISIVFQKHSFQRHEITSTSATITSWNKMLSNWAVLTIPGLANPTLASSYAKIIQLYHPAFLWLFFLTFTWLSWRCWRFTARPFLRPNEIKELPYWVPCKPF